MSVADPDASSAPDAQLGQLKLRLQSMKWDAFEALVPELVERLIGIRFSSARAGFQDGADAGTVGRSGRRLRIEAKRYTGDFDARDVIGGLRQAIARDPALEAWIAASTRAIPEQLANALEAEGANDGVPVLTIDWPENDAPALAALCTAAPDIVSRFAGDDAGRLAEALAPVLERARARLADELEEWTIGFEPLRRQAAAALERIWRSQRTALARFGQDVAAGDGRPIIRRTRVSESLDEWWNGRALVDAPAAVLGQGGSGKTWAALGWLLDNLPGLPIVITLPAGSVTPAQSSTVEGMARLIGAELARITGVRDDEHWARRVGRLLKRPPDEGPVFCLLFDGVNQNPAIAWLSFLQTLQDTPFAGRVRAIVTTRPQYFENQLGRMRRLAEPGERLAVDPFDIEPGGELDQLLAAHLLSRQDLSDDLVDLARIPRLFGLVIRLRDRLVDIGKITPHRLLWEYGRDALGERAGHSFSEEEWRAWLAEVARRARSGLRSYTLAELGETAARRDLSAADVQARLSDIVDGNLTRRGLGGIYQLAPDIVAHALGAALLETLDIIASAGEASVEAELAEWLDPISGLEERAELLRAATSIMASREAQALPEVAGALVTAWLQTQNLPQTHLNEIYRLAPHQVPSLLAAIERSDDGPYASAQALAIEALRSASSEDPVAYGLIIATCAGWLARVSRDVPRSAERHPEAEAARAKHIRERIGVDESGAMIVLGVPLQFQDRRDDSLNRVIATILDGRPLAGATEIFLRAALVMGIRGRQEIWDDLKWLCLLNERDPDRTAAALRRLSAEVAERPAEPGVHPELAARVASLLLWLTGIEEDEVAASARDPGIDFHYDYERDYLANPGQSLFRLERRHAAAALADRSIGLQRRCDRASAFLIDPSFEPPAEFVEDIREAAAAFDMSALAVGRYQTEADHDFEQVEPALARCAPDLLADMHRRKLEGYRDRPVETFKTSAWSAFEAIMLADDAQASACRAFRERGTAAGAGINESSAIDLLIVEIFGLPAEDQIRAILGADPPYISTDFEHALRPLSAEAVDALIEENRIATAKRQDDLLCLLSATEIAAVSESSWSWMEARTLDPSSKARGCGFDLLRSIDTRRFGAALHQRDWIWSAEVDDVCRHHGSLALIAATLSLPFEEVAPRIAPALLARAVALRGGAPTDARLAAEILDGCIMRPLPAPPDTGSTLTVHSERRETHPYSLSITPGPMPGEEGDPLASLTRDGAEQRGYSRRAVEAALASIREARDAGASLYLSTVAAGDLAPIVEAAPEIVAVWLEGMAERSRDFRRRVHLAEGFFLALCEALLATVPARGAELWQALRASMHVRHLGIGGVNELVLMLFRVAENPIVLDLRQDLLSLGAADTDERLLDVTVAAIAYGKQDWLPQVRRDDEASLFAWRRRRAVMLEGFSTGASLPVGGTHPEGADVSLAEDRRAAAARRLSLDGCARHWWRRFVAAEDDSQAYAAWVLFRASADRRALAWLGKETWPDRRTDERCWRKAAQFALNQRELVRQAERREKNADSQLFDKRTSNHVSPWYRPRPSET